MTDTQNAAAPAPSEATSTKKAKSDAYGAAVSRLKDEFRERFNALVAEEMRARNIEWSPRPTAQEKAAAEIKRLLDENPDLIGNPALRSALGV